MPRSNWFKQPKVRLTFGLLFAVLLCAGWIAYGLLESTKYERESAAKTDNYSSYTRDKVAKACVGIPFLERVKCLQEAEDAKSEYEYKQADLVAQRQSALWAYIMAAAAVIGMCLSVIGVWLVWTTFRETRAANEIAGTSVRAWLSVTFEFHGPGEPYKSQGSGFGYGFTIAAVIKNHGASPASDVRMDATLHLFRHNSAIPTPFDSFCDDWRKRLDCSKDGGFAVFPDQESPASHQLFLPEAELISIREATGSGWISMAVLGCVSYRTAHASGIRQTRFMAHLSRMDHGRSMVIDTAIAEWWMDDITISGPITIKAS